MQRIRCVGQRLAVLSLLPTLILATSASHATLGGAVTPITGVSTQQKVNRQVNQQSNYQVHELSIDGTVVREYVNGTGTVFAVVWQGQFAPNLYQLLGDTAFQRLGAAGRAAHAGHRQLQVQDTDLVIQSINRARSSSGRAYLPALIPAGVGLDTIQ